MTTGTGEVAIMFFYSWRVAEFDVVYDAHDNVFSFFCLTREKLEFIPREIRLLKIFLNGIIGVVFLCN